MRIPENRNLAGLPHVLVIDDDERISSLVSRYLHEHDFIASTAKSTAEARLILRKFIYDALVVDVMMPGETGLEFTKDIKKDSDIPVILLTALGETEDRIAGLECGADDYLAKPFEPRELVLRLQAILRRREKMAPVKNFKIGRWVYNPDLNELNDGGDALRLTTVEGNLLRALASRPGEIISREQLAILCGIDTSERTIDVQVARLRRKLDDDARRSRCLQTIRGKGYMLRTGEEG